MYKIFFCISLLLFASHSSGAFANTPTSDSKTGRQKLEKSFGNWAVFTLNREDQKICYIASIPTAKEYNYHKRGEPYIIVTIIKDQISKKGVAEVSISSGYIYKENAKIVIEVFSKNGDTTFELLPQDTLAWAATSLEDKQIIAALKKSARFRVKSASSMDKYSIDTYSLDGFSSSFSYMQTLCDVIPF